MTVFKDNSATMNKIVTVFMVLLEVHELVCWHYRDLRHGCDPKAPHSYIESGSGCFRLEPDAHFEILVNKYSHIQAFYSINTMATLMMVSESCPAALASNQQVMSNGFMSSRYR